MNWDKGGNRLGRRAFAASMMGGLLAAPAIARAEGYPSGRVTMIVPFPAGAATDLGARLYSERLSAIWGQPVVVDNRGGGNGIPAAEAASRAKPDGLTIFATSAMTQAVNPALYEKLPYDPVRDFEAITRMGTSPFVLLVDAKSPIGSAAELTAALKKTPGKNNFGAGALPARVASELYKMEADVEATYVGYKSNPQAIPDLQGGLLSFMMIDTVNAKIAIDRGTLKGLLVTDTERYAQLPDIPTAAEAGLPNVLLTTWTGYYVPKGTPRQIVQKINADIRKVAAIPEVRERLDSSGWTPRLMSPEEFAAYTVSEKERWGNIIRRANIKLE
ncbi:MAG: tripartite tricarboxylate transporter substrate binding protein [Alphaproteobacteria bacterium]|nr:tripartite tricarboxylate transporter substrate binding protein [Alphaproteobacteria bacterium]